MERAAIPNAPLRTILIASDNQGAPKLIIDGVFKQKTKHIAVKYRLSHDEQAKNHLQFWYIHTAENVADLLTKPLASFKHEVLIRMIGLRSISGAGGV